MFRVKNSVILTGVVVVTVCLFLILRGDKGTSDVFKSHQNTASFRHRKLLVPRSYLDESAQHETTKPKDQIPTIFIITPTYKRLTQIADMTRLANTLRNVKNIHWIVVEDGSHTYKSVRGVLEDSGISYIYLKARKYEDVSRHLKGIHQRNLALHWIRKYVDPQTTSGVFYFADDDNTYDVRIFEEMRYTKKISVWPVGFTSFMKYQRPIVKNGKVVDFISWDTEYRLFPVDMAAFALNIRVLFDYPMMYFLKDFYIGYQETQFLEQCCKVEELEPKAENCSKIFVWHTRTAKPNITETWDNNLKV